MTTINFKTLIDAYRAREALKAERISAEVVSVDASKTRHGCAFGLRIDRRNTAAARRILSREGVDHGDISG